MIKHKTKNIILIFVTFFMLTYAILDKFAFSFLIYSSLDNDFFTKHEMYKTPNILQDKFETDKYLFDYTGNSDEDIALKYLKLAHAITLKYYNMGKEDDRTFEQMLNDSIADCSDMSIFTISNYIFLVKNSNHEDLLNYIRFATGEAESKSQSGLHAWLEITLDGKWVPFETTVDWFDFIKIIPDKIPETHDEKYYLNLPSWKYKRYVTAIYTSDNRIEKEFHFWGIITSTKNKSLLYILSNIYHSVLK